MLLISSSASTTARSLGISVEEYTRWLWEAQFPNNEELEITTKAVVRVTDTALRYRGRLDNRRFDCGWRERGVRTYCQSKSKATMLRKRGRV